MSTTAVTTDTILSTLQGLVTEVNADKSMSLSDRINAMHKLTGRQIQVGQLVLGFRKVAARLPKELEHTAPLLGGPANDDEGGAA